MDKKKVIIIGAGPAGLTAAYELLKDNSDQYEVTIIEETNEIGGISRTVRYNGNRMDIGGHRFFSKDQEVMEFWENLMPLQGQPSYDDKKLRKREKIKKRWPKSRKTRYSNAFKKQGFQNLLSKKIF